MNLSAPLHIHWEVTNECNYDCQHCYQQNDEQHSTLTTDKLFQIAKKIVCAEVFQVSITGGEPFLVDSICSILEYLTKHNIDVIVCSNGSQLHEDHLEVLSRLSIPVQISLDSFLEHKHNNFRKSNNAFLDAVTAIQKLITNDINVSVAFCATQYNYEDIDGVVDLCIELGVEHLVIGEMIPVRDGEQTNSELLFTPETYRIFTQKLKQNVVKHKNDITIHINSEWGFVFSDFYEHVPCTALDRDFAVLHNGFVTPCPFVRNPVYYLGNLLETDIKQIWEQARESSFYIQKSQGCTDLCTYFSICQSGCKAQLANQNLDISRRDLRCPI